MNFFAISNLSAAIFCFVLALIALVYGRTKIHRLLLVFNLAVGTWGLAAYFVSKAATEAAALSAWKIAISSGLFIAVIFFHLVYVFIGLKRKSTVFLIYLQAFIFLYFTAFTDLVINRTRIYYSIFYYRANFIFSILYFVWLAIVFSAFLELYKFLKTTSGEKHKQALYLFFGFLTGFIGGSSVNIPIFNINIIPFGNITIPFYILIITYAILKHQLMDIKIGLSRASIFALISAIFIGIPVGLVYLNLFALSGLIVGISALLLAFIVLIYAKENIHYIWIIFNMAVTLWGFGMFFAGRAATPEAAAISWRLATLGGAATAVLFYHIVCIFCNIQRKKILIFTYLQLACFWVLIIFGKDIIFTGWHKAFDSIYYNIATLGYTIMAVLWFTTSILGYYELVRFIKRSSGVQRMQGIYLLVAFLIGFTGSGLTLLPAWGVNLYPFGNFGVAAYIVIGTYAILRYRLMDIRVAITRAGLFAIVYTLILGFPFMLGWLGKSYLAALTSQWWLIPTGLGILLASAGPFIYQYLSSGAEGVILKEQKRYQDALIELSRATTHIRDLDQLLKEITFAIADATKISFCALYLKENEYQWFKLKSIYPESEKRRLPDSIAASSAIIANALAAKRPLLTEEIVSFKRDIPDASVVVPCFIKDELSCFLVLGLKPDNSLYTSDDIRVLETLSYSIGLSIENSQFWKEIEDRQREARLQEMDTYSYSLAHEIDNPVQMVLGHADLLENDLRAAAVDEKKRADMKESLFFIKDSAQRVAKMVKAIRDFGKPVTGEYVVLNIADILEDFKYLFLPKLKEESAHLNIIAPKKNLIVQGEKTELVQVLVILGNNSLHAMKQASAKEISIEMKLLDNGFIRITFKDTGCGIKKELLQVIFTPFTTTKASAEGTGMGLYNAKKIIERHKGKIWAESEGEGKGAVFYIEIPIAKSE